MRNVWTGSTEGTTRPTAAEHDHLQRQAPVRVLAVAVAVLCVLIVWLAWYAWQLSADAAAARRAADAVAAQSSAQAAALAEAQSRTRDALCATIYDSIADEIPTAADARLRASYARLGCIPPLPATTPTAKPTPGAGQGPAAPGTLGPTAQQLPSGPGGREQPTATPRPPAGPAVPAPQPTTPGLPGLPSQPTPTPTCTVVLLGICL